MKCGCVDVKVGSWDNQVSVRVPDIVRLKYKGLRGTLPDTIRLDACIADEVASLWAKGIVVKECCRGHNRTMGYIGVIGANIPKMKALGYRVILNPQRPTAEDSFLPKYDEA